MADLPFDQSQLGLGPEPTAPPVGAEAPETVTYGAELPLEKRLRPEGPGAAFHAKILAKVNARQELSSRVMQKRYPRWDESLDTLQMFLDLSRQAKKADGTTNTKKKEMPFERAIVIPVSFAIHDVRVSQLLSLYASRKPIFPIGGDGPEDVRPAKLMEAALDYDADQSNLLLVLHQLFKDADRFGCGFLYESWEEEPGTVFKWGAIAKAARSNPMIHKLVSSVNPGLLYPTREHGITREFNRWTAPDPYNVWPDPRVPLSDLQRGEFFGHRTYEGRLGLLERDGTHGGPYFNIDLLESYAGGKVERERSAGSKRSRFSTEDFVMKEGVDEKDRGIYAVDHMQIKLIPREWEIAEGPDPEIWWFDVADNGLIIRAHVSAYEHGRFTYSGGEVLPDAHETLNPGMVEMLDGIQRTSDWLWNSRIANIVKMLNNSLIFSPLWFELSDILNPNPAGSIRLTAAGVEMIQGGSQINALYQQMQVHDVTAPHQQMAGALFDMAQRMAAASDPQLGQPTDEKRTLGEIQSIIASASQRIRLVGQMADTGAIGPSAQRAIANRQQFTTLEKWLQVTGDLAKQEEGGLGQILVNREQLQGNFDYQANTAQMPADPARSAELWARILEMALKAPQFQMPRPDGKILDLHEIFAEVARSAGAKNIDQFYSLPMMPPGMMGPPGVMPDEQLQQGVQAGNIVPMQRAG